MTLSNQTRNGWKNYIKACIPPMLLAFYKRMRRSAMIRKMPDLRGQEIRPFYHLPTRSLEELFPSISSTEVSSATAQILREDVWEIPLTELLTLAAICRYTQPWRIFEIGTYMGSSTLVMGMNTPPQTEIYTVDLDPSERDTHRHGMGIGGLRTFSVGELYQNTPWAKKIHQLFGNSLTFDYGPFHGSIDLILVDADHTYDFVKADTENAFRLLGPGGIIVWDDYIWNERHPECVGVAQCLHELLESRRVFQVAGTRFAIYIDGA